MSQRLALTFALAAAGCGSSTTTTTDMGAGAGNDMPMVMSTTIAQAVQGKVTTPITVTAIVTGIVGAGTTSWYVQDPAGGLYSGVMVFCDHKAKMPCSSSINAPNLGDLISVTGTLSQYHGKNELVPTAQTTVKTGQTPPTPMTIAASDAAYNQTNAGLRGMPVKVMGSSFTVTSVTPAPLYDTKCAADAGAMTLCSGCMPPSYSGFAVSDGTSTIYVEQSFYTTDKLVSSPECVSMAASGNQVTVNEQFTALGGILDVDPYAPKGSTVVALQPTSASDYAHQ